jgi:beta-lactamase class A
MKIFQLTAIILLLTVCNTFAEPIDSLKQEIQKIISSKNATIGIAVLGNNGQDVFSINGERHFPMQSVFKFHIGLAMLSEIDRGNFKLNQKIKIKKSELLPGLWSPIREKYPEGANLSIAEILEYTISQSDNVGCDILLKILGGPNFVENYIKASGVDNISIKINEEVMQNNWDRQFENWTTPLAANQILELFFLNESNLLSPSSYDFIWKIMKETATGKKRLKGNLPVGTVVAHKTGWSGTNKETGITAAVNDIGVVFLPDNNNFFISVFITDSKENAEVNEKIIADISKATWDYFISKAK